MVMLAWRTISRPPRVAVPHVPKAGLALLPVFASRVTVLFTVLWLAWLKTLLALKLMSKPTRSVNGILLISERFTFWIPGVRRNPYVKPDVPAVYGSATIVPFGSVRDGAAQASGFHLVKVKTCGVMTRPSGRVRVSLPFQ